jgi:hypothetical protein
MAEPIDFKQGKENKLARGALRELESMGAKTRHMTKELAEELGVRIESKPGAVMGRLVETKPGGMRAFREHADRLDREERDAAAARDRANEALARRSKIGLVHDMSIHGEGKPYKVSI